MKGTVIERFLAKVKVVESGCWEWRGSLNTGGYGKLKNRDGIKGAHRISYEIFKGAIPENLEIDHLCRNRKCVNPNHLELVTHQENILRGEGLCAQYAKQTHCVHGHPFDENNTRIRIIGTRFGRVCRLCDRDRYRQRKAKECQVVNVICVGEASGDWASPLKRKGMKITIRREVTIEIEGDIREAKKIAKRYEKIGYTRFEENDEWIQLDKHIRMD